MAGDSAEYLFGRAGSMRANIERIERAVSTMESADLSTPEGRGKASAALDDVEWAADQLAEAVDDVEQTARNIQNG